MTSSAPTTGHDTTIEVPPTSRSCGSPASSTPRPRRCSGRTSTPSWSPAGSDRAGRDARSTAGTPPPAALPLRDRAGGGEEHGFHGSFHEVRPTGSCRPSATRASPRRRARDPSPDRPRRRPDPARGDLAGRLVRGARRLRGQRHGDGAARGLPAPRRAARAVARGGRLVQSPTAPHPIQEGPMSVVDSFRLDGKVAVVTGGNRGLGRAFAQALGEAGASVAVLARDGSANERAVGDLTDAGITARSVVADVADRASVVHGGRDRRGVRAGGRAGQQRRHRASTGPPSR